MICYSLAFLTLVHLCSGQSVALAFWGLTRSLKSTLPSIKEKVVTPLISDGWNVQTFLHTYTISGAYTNPHGGEHNITLDGLEYMLLKPDKVLLHKQEDVDQFLNIENYSKHGDPWEWENQPFVALKNHLRALYSLCSVTQLVETSGRNFDVVIFLRADVEYLSTINTGLLRHLDPNTIYVPDFHGPLNDRFAVGKWPVQKLYGCRFWAAEHYAQQHKLHSESFLLSYLRTFKINTSNIPFYFRRVRANGAKADADVYQKFAANGSDT